MGNDHKQESDRATDTKTTPTSAADTRDDLRKLAQQLVRLPSENPPGNEKAAAEFVSEWFRNEGIDAELVTRPDPERPQVGARVGTGDPTVVLNGHLDVVPAGDEDAWSVDPYAGKIEDGRLIGRGAADMKTGVAIAMLVARNLAPDLRSGALEGSVVVHAAMGEETADPGTKTLLEDGYDGDFGIVLEPTDFRVATSSKGLAVYRLTVSGEATHASHPDEGINAIDETRGVLEAIDEYNARLRNGPDSLCGRALATVTEIEAGTESNLAVVPDSARLILDRRIRPDESLSSVDAEIEALVTDVYDDRGIEVTWERIQSYASSSIPVDHPLATRLRDLTLESVGDSRGTDLGEPWGIQAATDVRNFVIDADIPAVTWGPGRLEEAHTVDESISLPDAERGLAILERGVRGLLSGTENGVGNGNEN